MLKTLPLRGLRGSEDDGRENMNCLENVQIVVNKWLAETMGFKGTTDECPERIHYWELEKRRSLLYKAEVLSTFTWKMEIVNDKIVLFLPEELSKHSVNVKLGFFLMLVENCERKEVNWTKNYLKKNLKESELGDLVNYQLIQTANNVRK